MFAFWIMESFDVVEDVLPSLLLGSKCALPFEQAEEAL